MLQVIIDGKVVYEDDAIYHVLPIQLVSELERKWNTEQLNEAGISAGVAIVIPSIMNTKYYQSMYEREFIQ